MIVVNNHCYAQRRRRGGDDTGCAQLELDLTLLSRAKRNSHQHTPLTAALFKPHHTSSLADNCFAQTLCVCLCMRVFVFVCVAVKRVKIDLLRMEDVGLRGFQVMRRNKAASSTIGRS